MSPELQDPLPGEGTLKSTHGCSLRLVTPLPQTRQQPWGFIPESPQEVLAPGKSHRDPPSSKQEQKPSWPNPRLQDTWFPPRVKLNHGHPASYPGGASVLVIWAGSKGTGKTGDSKETSICPPGGVATQTSHTVNGGPPVDATSAKLKPCPQKCFHLPGT